MLFLHPSDIMHQLFHNFFLFIRARRSSSDEYCKDDNVRVMPA
jgi:hypothetical protein